jgi:hypothetical protein
MACCPRIVKRRINSLIDGEEIELDDLLEIERLINGRYKNRKVTIQKLVDLLASEMYRLKSVQADYLVCRTWDGTTEGDTDVYIAKEPKLRHSITSETIAGTTYYYTYPGTGAGEVDGDGAYLSRYRLAYSDSGHTSLVETCVVTPEWLPNDILFADLCTHSGVEVSGDELTLVMKHPRFWARQA